MGTDAASETRPATAGSRRATRRRLGEVLVDADVITEGQLQEALGSRRTVEGQRERLGHAIVRLGFASHADVAVALGRQLGLDSLTDERLPIRDDVTGLISASLAERHEVVPLRREEDGSLVVAMGDPTNVVALDDLRLATGIREIRPVVVPHDVLVEALRRAFDIAHRSGQLMDEFAEGRAEDDALDEDLHALGGGGDAPIVRLAEGLLKDALAAGASDLHVEAVRDGVVVRQRIDGVLHEITRVPRRAREPLLSRLKLVAGMDIAEKRRPQDGRAQITAGDQEVDLRCSTLPSVHGEGMVLRLLRKGEERLGLDQLGMSAQQLESVRTAFDRPQGLVLITGPTGSGKTSTLYAGLARLAGETTKIITLEDPVEYELDGIHQTHIRPDIGLTFAQALRTVLRQDPDVVMLGEIRDPEPAEIALQASLTGHLVLSTLHTNDAVSAVTRLRDLGIPPYLIAGALTLIVGQRLVRTVCPGCAESTTPTDDQIAMLRIPAAVLEGGTWQRGRGCRRCGGTGYKGRIGLYEVVEADEHLRELIAQDAPTSSLWHRARLRGAKSLREDGLAKAAEGRTTVEEILRVAPNDETDASSCPTCRQLVEPSFEHCPWCAADLSGHACGACGHELRAGWVVCPSCGEPIAEG